MSVDEIKITQRDRILEIAIERPAKKNALTLAMYDALTAALSCASSDADVRVVVVRGTEGGADGEGAMFTSGNDLNDFMRAPPAGDDSPVARFLEAIRTFEKPLVAAVAGHAIGVGTTMLFHCDLVYAAESARFQMPFVNLALVPEAASSFLLPRLVGHARAAELLFFGEAFDAKTAEKFGLVNEVMPGGALLGEVRRRAGILAAKPPVALAQTKRLLKQPLAEETRAHMRAEGAVFVERLASPELAEAIGAFFEKRAPKFG
jgi:enoyl-CoA hydratase/carnithine racemase